ncbi:MAG TPA: HEAT repeat domain-containing protein [Polyangiales bacterium]|nr:HEAT repeat domain-containing protein [Polyangiales bacterium]
MMRVRVLCFLVLGGCAGSAAETRVTHDVARGDFKRALTFYEQEGRSPQLLRALSEGVLLAAARAPDPEQRRAAFVELSMLGTRAESLLEALSAPVEPLIVRAEALRLRTELGDDAARRTLRGLFDHPNPEISDSAVLALRPEQDLPAVEAALRSPRSGRRAAALTLLRKAKPEHRALLSEVARFDPSPQLRAAALYTLERYGAEAADALEAATQDSDEQVRAAALAGLARVAPERAELLLDQQLGAAVSTRSIDAAITLLSLQPARQEARARAALSAALSSPDATLRAQTAAALARLPSERLDLAQLRACLRVEKAPSVRLALALALGPEDPSAQRTLAELSTSFSLIGAQAAAELAARSGKARTRLVAFSTHTSALVRITAARLIARELRDPAPITQLLADANWQVRDAAAGAVLNVM